MRLLLAIAIIALVAMPVDAGGRDAELPKKYRRSPYNLMSLTVGYPNKGWHLRPMQLKPSKYLRIKDSSKQNRWGHPSLVKMLRRNARDIGRTVKGSVMLVGDLSSKSGGPLTGHRSHQSGRDADVAYFARDRDGKRVELDKFVAFNGYGKAKDNSGLVFDDHRNWLLVQSWIKDHRAGLSHIFVSAPIKQRLVKYAKSEKRFKKHLDAALKLLKQPRRSGMHDDHFHLRISCPKKQKEICHEEPK